MEKYCKNLFLSLSTLVSSFMRIENSAGNNSLGGHLCSLRVYMTSVQLLLALVVSGKRECMICTH